MTSESDYKGLVVEDIYHRSFSDMSQLQQQLPENAVAALAREVLKRLERQVKEPQTDYQSIFSLAEALISSDSKTAAALIDERYRGGADVQTLYLQHLAPAATMLGEWWDADEVTFTDVAVGTGRIYSIMRSLRRHLRPDYVPEQKSAFFAAVPGEDHVLGLKMATDLARKAGWNIELNLSADHDALVDEITESGQLLIGLSAGGVHSLPNLARLILALRISAPKAKLVLSGAVLDMAGDKVELMHPDATARSFDDAMLALDTLWHSFHDT